MKQCDRCDRGCRLYEQGNGESLCLPCVKAGGMDR